MKDHNVFVGQKWRSIIYQHTATVREVQHSRVLVSIEGSREWLHKSELFSAWKPVSVK